MKTAIGIDLGGTKIEGVLVTATGKVLMRERLPTDAKRGKQHVIGVIDIIITKLKRGRPAGVGIGVPGTFDNKGRLLHVPNVRCLESVNLKQALKKHKLPVFIENDAKCFALAEQMMGAGKGSKAMLGVILGTGVGSGIVIDGKVYRGAHGAAGEIGHMVATDAARALEIGRNDWETLLAGPGIVRRYEAAGGRKGLRATDIMAGKDPAAKKARNETIRLTALFLGSLMSAFDPDVIVLGGGVSNSDFYKELNLQAKAFAHPSTKCKILKNRLGDSAGVIGAAALVF